MSYYIIVINYPDHFNSPELLMHMFSGPIALLLNLKLANHNLVKLYLKLL